MSPLASLTRSAPRVGRRRAIALALAGALTTVTTGCAVFGRSAESPASTAPTTAGSAPAAPADPAVNYTNPAAVCEAFTRALLTVDTTTDRSRNDALARTAAYVTGPMLAATPAAVADAQWREWTSHRARTEVTIGRYAGDAPGSSGRTRVSLLARVTPVGGDGWRGPTQRYAVHCELDRHSDTELRVSAYALEPLGT